MKPSRIFLIRHGESQTNVDPTLFATVPDWKVELTDLGHRQSFAAGKRLAQILNNESLGVYISSYYRTRQTWDDMLRNLPPVWPEFVKEDPRLREQERGNFRTASVTAAEDEERKTYGTFFYRIPGGESGADVYDRSSDFIDTLHRSFEKSNFPANVLIVGHGFSLRIFLMRWFHWTPEEFQELANIDNCELIEMQLNSLTQHYELVTRLKTQEEVDMEQARREEETTEKRAETK